ncbi:MAG: peptide deformylase [Bacteroidota bacterium]
MIYPIVAYGDPVLRKKTSCIEQGTEVKQFAEDMIATMNMASGVGLAAPQVGKSISMFVADFSYILAKDDPRKRVEVFINPVVEIAEGAVSSNHQEGCLSIPDILLDVPRKESITIRYFDADWRPHVKQWTGFPARIILHEYDHLEGKLHIDYVSPFRKQFIESRLNDISKGNIEIHYEMRFPG